MTEDQIDTLKLFRLKAQFDAMKARIKIKPNRNHGSGNLGKTDTLISGKSNDFFKDLPHWTAKHTGLLDSYWPGLKKSG